MIDPGVCDVVFNRERSVVSHLDKKRPLVNPSSRFTLTNITFVLIKVMTCVCLTSNVISNVI